MEKCLFLVKGHEIIYYYFNILASGLRSEYECQIDGREGEIESWGFCTEKLSNSSLPSVGGALFFTYFCALYQMISWMGSHTKLKNARGVRGNNWFPVQGVYRIMKYREPSREEIKEC